MAPITLTELLSQIDAPVEKKRLTLAGAKKLLEELEGVAQDELQEFLARLETVFGEIEVLKKNIEQMRGPQGEKGDTGYAPIKNIDYFDGKDGKDGLSIKGDSGLMGPKPVAGIDYPLPKDGKNGADGS